METGENGSLNERGPPSLRMLWNLFYMTTCKQGENGSSTIIMHLTKLLLYWVNYFQLYMEPSFINWGSETIQKRQFLWTISAAPLLYRLCNGKQKLRRKSWGHDNCFATCPDSFKTCTLCIDEQVCQNHSI